MDDLLELYCVVDDFLKDFLPKFEKKLLESGQKKSRKSCSMSLSEIMTIMIYFHQIKLALRYAQNAPKKCIGDYLRRWNSWCVSVLKCCTDEPTKNTNFPCNNNQGVGDEKKYWDIGTIA